METFAERLRKALDDARLTPAELSRRAFVSRATVSQWLSGTIKSMSSANLDRVAHALSVDPNWLLGRSSKVQEPASAPYKVEPDLCAQYNMLLDDQKQQIASEIRAMVEANRILLAELQAKYRTPQ